MCAVLSNLLHDCRALAQCSSFSAGTISPSETAYSVTRAAMRALLKTYLVDEVLHDLHDLLPAYVESPSQTRDIDTLVEVFQRLQLPFSEDAASDHDMIQCFRVRVGALTSSIP